MAFRGGRLLRMPSTVRTAIAAVMACALAICVASTAMACSLIMGPLTFNPPSGPAGSVVYTSVTGLKPYPARYELFFGGTCMTFSGKLLKTITTNASGGWKNKKVTIPAGTAPGQYPLCGIEAYPVRGETATSHSSFTVV